MIAPPCFSLWHLVKTWGECPALEGPGCHYTYREYYRAVCNTAQCIEMAGLKKGDRMAVIAPNSTAYVILLMAMWELGVVPVLVSTRWPAMQVQANLEKIRCSRVIIGIGLIKLWEVTDIPHLILEDLVRTDYQANVDKNDEPPALPLDQEATILFTSGSSGLQKGIMHTLGNHYYSALGSNSNIPIGPGDCWLLSLPLYHVSGIAILFRAILGGGMVAVPGPDVPLEEALQGNITHLSMVSTQLHRLLQKRSAISRLQGMKAILLGGSSIPQRLIKRGIAHGLPLYTSYGSTEMASQVTTTGSEDPPDRLFSAGKLLPYREMTIAPDGEILMKGATLFKGYVEGATISRDFDQEGWFRTGDLGHLDGDGYLTVTGRKDNLFISGGENIQPEEIEFHLCRLPGVKQAIVVPVKDNEFGHRPVAFVEMEGKGLMDPYRFASFLEKRLARFKIPDRFLPWPESKDQLDQKPNRQVFRRHAEEILSFKS